MSAPPGPPAARPFFLPAGDGERYCLYYGPDPARPVRGAILYVHPFAEELNKTRRMAALQARAFAQAGYGVLQIDLYGCGDSSGDFADARWPIWQHDLALACRWLRARTAAPLSLWGLRLGALLALACCASLDCALLILWQPVLNGRVHLHQFQRTHQAARMLSGMLSGARPTDDDEVAGYRLASELAQAIGALDAGAITPACPVHWFELAGIDGAELPPASASLLTRWRDAGVAVRGHPVAGQAFWASTEIVECGALLAATAMLEAA